MKAIYRLILAAFAVFVCACTVDVIEQGVVTAEDETASAEDINCSPGVVVVKFTEEMGSLVGADLESGNVQTKSSELNNIFAAYGITSVERVFSDDERWLERQHREGLHLWYRITYDPSAALVTKAVSEFGQVPGVELAEAEPVAKPTANFYNDTYYGSQWHLNGTYDINVETVWEHYTKGESNVIVSVVDGGIDPNHPDLMANLISAGVGGSKNFYQGNYVITADGHGTHVAGIISAVSNNGVGVAGIAGGDYQAGISGVKLLSCQVFSGDDSDSSTFPDAVRYGADNGALICQNSWGYSYETEMQAKNASTPAAMTAAIDYFVKYAGCDNNGDQLPTSLMKGGVVIFAAGNDGWQYGHPADYEGCIAVGATTKNGLRADYSNYGDWVDICAPGSDIYSTYYSSGSTYASASGTSMACPMVSGVAALVLSYQGGQGFTAEQLWECLIDGADPNKVSATNVGPYLDAEGAVLYGVIDPPDNIDGYEVSTSGNTIYFTWKVPSGDEEGTQPAYGMLLCASTDKSSIDNLNPKNPGSGVNFTNIRTNGNAIGEEVTGALTVDEFNTTYYVTCAPFNYGSRFADVAETKTVSTGSNNPPVITPSVDVTNVQVGASKTVRVSFSIVDPDNHDVTVDYRSSSIAERWVKSSDTTYELILTGSAMDSDGNYVSTGYYTSSITATDAYGASTSLQLHYTILDNQAPIVGDPIENVLLVLGSSATRSAELTLDNCFVDPDGDDMKYTVNNSSSHTVQATVTTTEIISGSDTTSTTKLYLTGMNAGTSTITIIASDARGLSCEQTIIVPVRAEGETVVAYPNPVTDILYVGTEEEEMSTKITVASSTGSTVYQNTSNVSAFKPAQIDFTKFAPGTYSLKVEYGGKEVTKNVVKR